MSIEVNEKIQTLLSELRDSNVPILRFLANKRNFNANSGTVLYSGPYWDDDEIVAAMSCFLTGKWLTSGEAVRKFEVAFCKKFNGDHGVMVNSGSSANLVMIAALKKCLGWKDGDEIIVSVVGFPTTVNPIVQCRLKPVFVDIEHDGLNWSLDDIVSKITPKTVAVFSSPVLGNPCNFDELLRICTSSKISLISDNCDSLGTKWKGEYLSSYSVASSHSFYPAHHITTGEGGLVMSNYENIVKEARSFAWWGRDCHCVGAANMLCNGTCGKRFDNWLPDYDGTVDHRYVFVNQGYNLKPLDLQGAIGTAQLKKFDDIHRKRKINKALMDRIFSNRIQGIKTVDESPYADVSWFGTPLICENKQQKIQLVNYLEANKIQTRNYFAGNMLLHPAYKELGNPHDYPCSKKVLDCVFFVGCSPHYNDDVFDYVDSTLSKFKMVT